MLHLKVLVRVSSPSHPSRRRRLISPNYPKSQVANTNTFQFHNVTTVSLLIKRPRNMIHPSRNPLPQTVKKYAKDAYDENQEPTHKNNRTFVRRDSTCTILSHKFDAIHPCMYVRVENGLGRTQINRPCGCWYSSRMVVVVWWYEKT